MAKRVIFGKQEFLVTSDELDAFGVAQEIHKQIGISPDSYYLLQNGKLLDHNDEITSNVHCILRTLGGKGGFGSMLRAIGAQIEKTTNREACRDLSGRRLRDINEEKRLKAWLDKQKDREAEAEEKRRKKIEKLIAVPKHEFKDSAYESARSELTEKVSEAVEEGFKKANLKPAGAAACKRKAMDNGKATTKKAALWIADDLSSSSDTESESDEDDHKKTDRKEKECVKATTSSIGETTSSESNSDSFDTEKYEDDKGANSITSDSSKAIKECS